MPLDKPALQAAIKQAFKKAKETPPPSDPAQTDQVQVQILDQLSQDLANAVEAYVKSGDVGGVVVQVRDLGNNVIGTGTQTGTVKIQ